MATLSIKYGGQTLGSISIAVTRFGHYVKATISGGDDELLQLGHIWKNTLVGDVGRGRATVDSTGDHDLEIVIAADSEDECRTTRTGRR
jgi:hypothetical protein